MSKKYTWAEVAKHNTEQDLWIVIKDGVYDVTSYMSEHPGGPLVLSKKAGMMATTAFEQAAHSKNAKQTVMPKYRIGEIDLESEMEEWQKQPISSGPNIIVTVAVVVLILTTIYFLAA